MPTLNTLIDPQEILAFVRGLDFPDEFPLQRFLPEVQLEENEFQWIVDNRVDVAAARHRAWDSAVPLRSRQGVSKARGQLAPIGDAMMLTEEETLQLRAMGTGNFTRLIDAIYDDMANLTRGVKTRYELDRGRLISTGKVTLHFQGEGGGAGFDQEVDFGLDAQQIKVAATQWSDVANADIISDMTLWRDAYRLFRRGRVPGVALISTRIAGYLVRNVKLKTTLYPIGGQPSLIQLGAINAEMAANGLPTFEVFDQQLTNENGVVVNVLDDNKVHFLPGDRNIGSTFLGVTAEAVGMVNRDIITVQQAPGIIGYVDETNNPPRTWSHVRSVGMPAAGEINDLMIAIVAS